MTSEQLHQLRDELICLDKKESRAKRIAFAERHKVTLSAVEKRLRKITTSRKSPRAVRVSPDLEAAVLTIWNFKSTPDGQLATKTAQSLAFSEGKIPRTFAISSLNQAARALGLNPTAAYVQRVESDRANQTHFVDASGSRHFKVVERAEDGDWILQVVRAEQRNKRWHEGELLWMVAVVDDYSRVMSARYVVVPGESAAMVQEQLVNIWRTGPPLGMPEKFLICDQGSFGRERSTRALMQFYEIELVLGQPGNSQRNGRVERLFRPLKEDFERSYLSAHEIGARVRLSQLKEELGVYVVKANEGCHPIQRDSTRLEDWTRSIASRELRECPEDALRLATYREQRTITNEGWVQHENDLLEIVDLPHGMRGRKIILVRNREGDLVAEHDGSIFQVRKATAIARGTYSGKKTQPAREVEKAAAERPRTGVGAYSKKRQNTLRALGAELTAPGGAVKTDANAPRLITPPPKLRSAEPERNPFILSRAHTNLEAARERLAEVIGIPLHLIQDRRGGLVFDDIRLARLDRMLAQNGLARGFTDELAYKLKKELRI